MLLDVVTGDAKIKVGGVRDCNAGRMRRSTSRVISIVSRADKGGNEEKGGWGGEGRGSEVVGSLAAGRGGGRERSGGGSGCLTARRPFCVQENDASGTLDRRLDVQLYFAHGSAVSVRLPCLPCLSCLHWLHWLPTFPIQNVACSQSYFAPATLRAACITVWERLVIGDASPQARAPFAGNVQARWCWGGRQLVCGAFKSLFRSFYDRSAFCGA